MNKKIDELIYKGQQLEVTDLELALSTALQKAMILLKKNNEVLISTGCELTFVLEAEAFIKTGEMK